MKIPYSKNLMHVQQTDSFVLKKGKSLQKVVLDTYLHIMTIEVSKNTPYIKL